MVTTALITLAGAPLTLPFIGAYSTLKSVPPALWIGGLLALAASTYEIFKGTYEYLLCTSAAKVIAKREPAAQVRHIPS